MSKKAFTLVELVIVIPDEVMSTMDIKRIQRVSSVITKELVELGFGGATISPQSDVFHAPFEEGFPKAR